MITKYIILPVTIDLYSTIVWGIVIAVIGGLIVEGFKGKLSASKIISSTSTVLVIGCALWIGYYNASFYLAILRGFQQSECLEGSRYWAEAQRKHPQVGLTYLLVGKCYFSEGDYTNAIEWLNVGKELEPRSEINYWLGRSYFEEKNLELAEQSLREALLLKPRHSDGQFYLGLVLHHQSEYQESLLELEKALNLNPRSPEINHWFAWSLYENGYYRDAIKFFQFSADNGFLAGRSHAGIGFCHLAMFNYGLARSEFEYALLLLPGQRDVEVALQSVPRD